ncbi:MAG: hypothetical protein K6B68_10505 [Eubacterium sp.]|nr:hypothetical protein [Eubacterium sp.]
MMLKERLKKIGTTVYTFLMILALAFYLTGCSSYTEHGVGTVIIQNNVSDKATVSFSSLNGSRVYKLKVKDAEDVLKYSGKLSKGSATVYYDNDGTKKELFSISDGEDVDSSLETLEKGTLYIIIETDGKAEGGDFSFSID